MPPLVCKVATKLLVFALPMFFKPKLIVTVSSGSTAPLVQVSATSAKLLEMMIGAKIAGPASASIRLVPVGVPQPVQRSKPVTAEYFVGLLLLKLLPLVMSWKSKRAWYACEAGWDYSKARPESTARLSSKAP